MTDRDKPLTADRVVPLLRGRFGRPYGWSAQCRSTQDAVREGALPEGAVAVTEHQTGGRGREGRAWEDAAGRSLLLSLVLRPPASSFAQQLSLVAGLAAAEAIDATAATRSQVKWPNDVLLEGRKVAGILLEVTGDAVICGIGVNVNQTEEELPAVTRSPAGSLRVVTGAEQDRARLLVEVLDRLERRYEGWRAGGLRRLLPELERRDWLSGRSVSVGGVSGTAVGIAPDGRLRIRGEDGVEALVASGEVQVRASD